MKTRWDVWLADVSHEENPEISEPRPVVILDSGGYFTFSLKGTSHEPRDNFTGEYKLMYWKEAGLKKETVIRCSKLLKLNDSDFRFKIGVLHPVDIINIQDILPDMPWFKH